MASTPEKIKVTFNGQSWEFDYSEDLDEKNIKNVLASQVPDIINAEAKISYENNNSVKVFKFEKKLGYKGWFLK